MEEPAALLADIRLGPRPPRKSPVAIPPGCAQSPSARPHPVERIAPLIAAGQRVFGENRVQEAEAKWPALREEHADVALHLVGQLQSNKAEEAVRLFDCIHSLDRPSLVTALAKAMDKVGRQVPAFMQVNIGAEEQKGVAPLPICARCWPARARRRHPDCRADVRAACGDRARARGARAALDKLADNQQPGRAFDGDERGFPAADHAGRHPRPRRQRPVRRAPATGPKWGEVTKGWRPEELGRNDIQP